MSLPEADRVKIWLTLVILPPETFPQYPLPVDLSVGDIRWQLIAAEWLEITVLVFFWWINSVTMELENHRGNPIALSNYTIADPYRTTSPTLKMGPQMHPWTPGPTSRRVLPAGDIDKVAMCCASCQCYYHPSDIAFCQIRLLRPLFIHAFLQSFTYSGGCVWK